MWSWDYMTSADHVVGGLSREQREGIERIGQRLADAVGIRRVGAPFDARESVSPLLSFVEGGAIVWYMEDYRDQFILITRIALYDPD